MPNVNDGTMPARPASAMTRLLLLAPLLLAACNRPATDVSPDDDAATARAAIANESKAIDGIVADARIGVLQNQINRLEAEVADLKGGKQALDTQLLAQRLDAVEQRVYARLPEASAPAPVATSTPKSKASSSRPEPTATPRRSALDLVMPKPER